MITTKLALWRPGMERWHILLFLVGYVGASLLLVACAAIPGGPIEVTRLPKETSSPTPEALVLSSPLPLPDFLYVVFPEPGATYTLAEFDELTEKYSSIAASGEVFFDVRLQELIEEGDIFNDVEEYFPRISARIDGQLYTEPQAYLRTNEWHQTYRNPETGEILYQLPGGMPFSLYYPMEREPGVHTVEVEIRKTSGEIVSYSWSFLLTE